MFLIVLVSLLTVVVAQKDPHYVGNRTTMVHLFEWKFADIAEECEKFLGPMGYAAVQVSPINEYLVIPERPWYERYQPLSYKIISRSGDEAAFRDMVRRCNRVGVRIFVDVVVNHMSADQSPAIGSGRSIANPQNRSYPAVPYTREDFHPTCSISNYNNATEVRNCELGGLHDLDQSKEHVRDRIVQFLNRVIDLGAAGLRVDAAKHMSPQDLKVIYARLKNLSTEAGFPPNLRPFIYQEVIDVGTGEAVKKTDYDDLAAVIEFQFGIVLGYMFRGQDSLKRLSNWGERQAWNLLASEDAVVMVDNHDNQRGHGAGGKAILTYKDRKQYVMAVAFMLAHPYGKTRVMSSYKFDDPSVGPPTVTNGDILSPKFDNDGQCTNGWVCEHRWRQIVNMVKFRNDVQGERVERWWSNGNNQIAFARGSKGFVAFNLEDVDFRRTLTTGLPPGRYCDVISGSLVGGRCTGKTIEVRRDGTADIEILRKDQDGVVAIHVEAKI